MLTSTDAAAGGAASPPSSPGGSPPSSPNAARWDKVRQADYLRLMQDNQRVLDQTELDNRRHREQTHRLREAQLRQAGAAPPPGEGGPPEDAMGDISIDSPRTVNHNYPAPPAPAAAPGLLARLAPWLVGAAPAVPVPLPPDPASKWRLRVVPAPGPDPPAALGSRPQMW